MDVIMWRYWVKEPRFINFLKAQVFYGSSFIFPDACKKDGLTWIFKTGEEVFIPGDWLDRMICNMYAIRTSFRPEGAPLGTVMALPEWKKEEAYRDHIEDMMAHYLKINLCDTDTIKCTMS